MFSKGSKIQLLFMQKRSVNGNFKEHLLAIALVLPAQKLLLPPLKKSCDPPFSLFRNLT